MSEKPALPDDSTPELKALVRAIKARDKKELDRLMMQKRGESDDDCRYRAIRRVEQLMKAK